MVTITKSLYITHHCPAMTPLELQNIHTDYIYDSHNFMW